MEVLFMALCIFGGALVGVFIYRLGITDGQKFAKKEEVKFKTNFNPSMLIKKPFLGEEKKEKAPVDPYLEGLENILNYTGKEVDLNGKG